MTKAERQRLDKVSALCCIVCGDLGYHGTPAEIHHQLGCGRDNNRVIPLCPWHHRNGSFGEAVHNGTKTWESLYGTQAELVDRVNILVPELDT